MKRINVIVAIGLAILIASCNTKRKEQKQEKAITAKYVKSTKVIETKFAKPVFAFGKLAAQEETKLSFKVAGIIESINVTEGQNIFKGQVLARLEQQEISAQVASAKANFDKWERDLQRMARLHKEKVVTLESYQNVKTQYDLAVSNLQIAEYNRKYATIISPIHGKVLRKFAEVNELTEVGKPIFLIGTAGEQMVIKAGLTDREVIGLKEGDSAAIQFDALPAKSFEGEVLMIDNAPNTASGLYEIEILMKEYHAGLRNGFFAKVRIFPSQAQLLRKLPIESLVDGADKKGFIYTVTENRAEKIEIEIYGIEEDQLLVSNMSKNCIEVVTDGAQYLNPNDEIIIVRN